MAGVILNGSTSGSVTLDPPAVAGSTVITLPSTSGTMALAGGAGSFTTVEASSTIKGASTISVGGATPSTSGAGITFPATQSASTDANTLDDYEEGTWTPNKGAGVTATGGFSSSGTYIKIGKVVTVAFTLNSATNPGLSWAAGAQLTTNLPFSSYNIVTTNYWPRGGGSGGIFGHNIYLTTATAITAMSATGDYASFSITYETT